MIIASKYNFAFVHIPKNGGSSIRDQLAGYDELNHRFFGVGTHPVLGRYYPSHVPMQQLASIFPDDYALLKEQESFAIYRDPRDRFFSSFAQRCREHLKAFPQELTDRQINDDFDTIIDHLETNSDFPGFEFAHFARQSDFIFNGDERVVDHIYDLNDLPDLIAQISRKLGRSLISGQHSNKTITFRNQRHKAIMMRVKDVAKAQLPLRAYNVAKDFGISIFAHRGASNVSDLAAKRPDVEAFIKRYYQGDAGLVHLLNRPAS
ncbi:MAG: sulfotransferase family 2 domain-containing protein [Pseudomonadota bacterium]